MSFGNLQGPSAPRDETSFGRLLQLPRYKGQVEDVFRLTHEVGKGVAGCFICDRPIPKGTVRLSFWIRLQPGASRSTETYKAHLGCLLAICAEPAAEARSRHACWDCGREPPRLGGRWPVHAYTTSRFAYAPLCDECMQHPRWRACGHCRIWFPHWMVSFSRQEDLLCDWCAQRSGIVTRRLAEANDRQLAKLRDEVLREGFLGGAQEEV